MPQKLRVQLNETIYRDGKAGTDPMFYNELELANHSETSAIDQQGVRSVNYLASNDYLVYMNDDHTVYDQKVDSLNELQLTMFSLSYSFELHYSST